ncbi:MAG: hypothetical protein IJF83_07375 [Methanobrevibacter sp.]|nr:hypothetical protein [Methanobrevibacter sp.]
MSQIEQFLKEYESKTPYDLYHSEIRIIDKDYDVELNGININRAWKGNGETLILETMNHRKLRLQITKDTQFLINGEQL